MAKFTEEDILMRRIGQRFNKGVVKYRLLEDDDKILVGLSGGKDSLALLELLAKQRSQMPCTIVNAVLDDVNKHADGAEQSDDITIMCIINKTLD